MFRPLVLSILVVFYAFVGYSSSDNSIVDSLLKSYELEKDPCEKSVLMREIAWEYMFTTTDVAMEYAKESVTDGLNCNDKIKYTDLFYVA